MRGKPAPPPIPARIGPFEIVARIGGGGQGVVYAGRHERTGERAAIKTAIRPEAHLIAAIRREVRALSRVRHPGILPVVASGDERGIPWYAMPIIEGRTLREYRVALAMLEASPELETTRITPVDATEVLPPAPDRVPRGTPPQSAAPPATATAARRALEAATDVRRTLFSLVHKLCETLAYLHGEGVLHRDVKPENVLVRDGDLPVLVDFGLMARYGGALTQEALEVEPGAVGTAAYVAPEQIQRDNLDARADLYALGCVLYELLSGRLPFPGDAPSDVLFGHLYRTPPALASLAPDTPPEIERLVMRMLAKKPSDRIGYAADVAAILRRHGATGFSEALPPARPYLYRPALRGRVEISAAMVEHVEGVIEGHGALVLLAGQSGLGKTRHLREAGRLSLRDGVTILQSECAAAHEDGSAAEPFRALREILATIVDECREAGADACARIFGGGRDTGGARGAILAPFLPSLATLPGMERAEPPAELPPEAAVVRLHRALWETLHAYAGPGRLVILVDDLQWADELTLGFLHHVAAVLPSSPLLVVGAFRPEEARRSLRRLRKRPGVHVHVLEPLDIHGIAAIVEDMLAVRELPDRLISSVAALAEGNPLFVAEYLRAAVDAGLLARDRDGRWLVSGAEATMPGMPVPRALVALIARRLEGLDAASREVAEALAVIGREADLALVARLSGRDEADVLRSAAELLERHVLDDEAPGPKLRLADERLRGVLQDGIPEERRRRLHLEAAEALEAAGHALPGIARHRELAGELARARSDYIRAARLAETRFVWREADHLYRTALELPLPGDAESRRARFEWATLKGRMLGRPADAVAMHGDGIEEARAAGDLQAEADHLAGLGWFLSRSREKREGLGVLGVARALYARLGDTAGEARVVSAIASVTAEQGRAADAMLLYQAAMALHVRNGNKRQSVIDYTNMATLAFELGETRKSEALLARGLELSRETAQRSLEGWILRCLAALAHAKGQSLPSRRYLEEALAIHRETGHRHYEAVTLSSLVQWCLQQGELDAAARHAAAALAIHRETGDRAFESMTLADRGHIHELSDEWVEARECHRLAEEAATSVDARRFQAATILGVARTDHVLGDVAAAREGFRRAQALIEELDERRELAGALADASTLERYEGNLEESAALAARSEEIASEVEDRPQQARSICERAYVALAAGRRDEAVDHVGRARRLVGGLASPAPPLLRQVSRLEASLVAGDEGTVLLHGQLPEDLPAPVRARRRRP